MSNFREAALREWNGKQPAWTKFKKYEDLTPAEQSDAGRKANLVSVLRDALRDLYEISGEANIPMTNSHAVRKMGKFVAARDKAKAALEQADFE